MLQHIGRGQVLKRAENLKRSVKGDEVHLMQDYEDIGILKRAENLDSERLVQEGEVNPMQGYGERGDVASRAGEGTSDTFEWVDFKRNGEF